MRMFFGTVPRRNLTPYQRGEPALELESLISPGQGARTELSVNSRKVDTLTEIAGMAGVGEQTTSRVKVIRDNADEEVKAELRRGETSINADYVKLLREEKEQKRENRRSGGARGKIGKMARPRGPNHDGIRGGLLREASCSKITTGSPAIWRIPAKTINESSSCRWGALSGDVIEFRSDTSHIGSSWSHAQRFEGQIDWVVWEPVADYKGVDDVP
jgi:hypothetical protein